MSSVRAEIAGCSQPLRVASHSILCLSIRPNTSSPTLPIAATSRGPRSEPNIASSSSGSYFRPGMTCPPVRPEAPHPMSWDSSSTTLAPALAAASAAAQPV